MNFEQLGGCAVKFRHKDEIARCGFPVGYISTLPGMPDIELLSLLKEMCDVMESQRAQRKFKSQTMKPLSAMSCKANTDVDTR